jgi:hypothetical protein
VTGQADHIQGETFQIGRVAVLEGDVHGHVDVGFIGIAARGERLRTGLDLGQRSHMVPMRVGRHDQLNVSAAGALCVDVVGTRGHET